MVIAAGDTVTEIGKNIWYIFQDKKSNYWFGSNGQGLYCYNGNTLLRYTTKHGLCNDSIRDIQEDRFGNLFFTTRKGISKFDGREFSTLPVAEASASHNEWRLEPNDMWFKGEDGKNGPYRYDGKYLYSLEFPKSPLEDEYYRDNPKPPFTFSPYEIYHIYTDSKESIWFGTSALGIYRYDGKSLSWMYERHLTLVENGGSFGIRSILEDKNGKFWFCNTLNRYTIFPKDSTSQDDHLIKYTKEKGIDLRAPNGDNSIYYLTILEDTKRDLWMTTYDLGVWRYDGKNTIHYPVKDDTKDINVISMYKDTRGDIWLGTADAGVYKFNGKTFQKFAP